MIDNPLYKKLVPITRVVNAALIDDYGDNTKSREQYMHWAARGVKGLQSQVLKLGKRRVMLDVNKSFQSATLPPDFAQENLQFVGYIDHEGYRVALGNDQKLTNEKSIENIECADACPKCNQDKGVCNDLDVTELEEVVIVKIPTGVVQAVGAIGRITINDVGVVGDSIQIFSMGISLGSYTRGIGDTSTTILAASIASNISANGYTITSNLNVITITAPSSLGASANGGLSLVITNYVDNSIFDSTFDSTFN